MEISESLLLPIGQVPILLFLIYKICLSILFDHIHTFILQELINYLCNFLKWTHQTLPLNTVVYKLQGVKNRDGNVSLTFFDAKFDVTVFDVKVVSTLIIR